MSNGRTYALQPCTETTPAQRSTTAGMERDHTMKPVHHPNDRAPETGFDRRQLLRGLAAGGVASTLAGFAECEAQPTQGRAVVNGRIKQSKDSGLLSDMP